MKILQINKYHYPKGGSETVYFNICNLLTEHGHSVIHFSMQDDRNMYSPTAQYFPENFDLRKGKIIQRIRNFVRFFYNREAKKKLEALILNEKPDVAHIHLFFNSLSMSIFQALKKHQIPVVLILHDHRLLCPSSLFMLRGKRCIDCKASLYTNCTRYKCYQNDRLYSLMLTFEIWLHEFFIRINNYVDRYLFISLFQTSMHLSYHQYYEGKYTRMYNFVPNLQQITPCHSKGEYFFFYGRIADEKGVRTLIEAAENFPDCRFKIAGNGPLLDEMQRISPQNVEFMGFQTGEKLYELIKNASFVIIPPEGIENNPMTIIESYAYGKPVIASDFGGVSEIVFENRTGFLFEMKSVEGLSAKITQANALSNDEYRIFSQNARQFSEANFDPEPYYQKLIDIYETIKK